MTDDVKPATDGLRPMGDGEINGLWSALEEYDQGLLTGRPATAGERLHCLLLRLRVEQQRAEAVEKEVANLKGELQSLEARMRHIPMEQVRNTVDCNCNNEPCSWPIWEGESAWKSSDRLFCSQVCVVIADRDALRQRVAELERAGEWRPIPYSERGAAKEIAEIVGDQPFLAITETGQKCLIRIDLEGPSFSGDFDRLLAYWAPWPLPPAPAAGSGEGTR